MNQLLLRHFHSNENQVSKHGLKQLYDVSFELEDTLVSCIIATDHPRVISSAKLLSDKLSVGLDVVSTNVSDCVSLLENSQDVLFLSQQPILAEVASLLSCQTYDPTHFLTGQLVRIERL
jgi:hypothetical protein